MKRFVVAAAAVLLALPILAQQKAAPQDPGKKPVAVINGEVVTQRQLDYLYNNLGAQIRAQYEKAGGKAAFLENYLRKRLVVQEAQKAGFDKRPEVQADIQAARESAVFDRYVRDVVAKPVVTEAQMRKYFEEHPTDFNHAESVKVRHILIMTNPSGPKPHTKDQAMQLIQKINTELRSKIPFSGAADVAVSPQTIALFAEAAQKYSEDGTAPNGGDVGWVERSQIDPQFADAAFTVKKGAMSGIVETRFGYHLILVEDKRPAFSETYDEARPVLREFLMAQHQQDVMNLVSKLTDDLRTNGKVSVYLENLD